MSFGALMDDEEVISEINMTPLVDVMLVLLIIFMITVPVIQHSVKLDLPHAANRVNDSRPVHINLGVKPDGTLSWNNAPITRQELTAKISEAAAKKPQPELHLYADRKTAYEHVAKVMAAAQSGGLAKIGFITEPNNTP